MSIFTMPEGETGGRLIGRSLGAGLGQGISQGITARLNDMFKKKEMLKRESEFLEKGFPPKLAALASVATTGGQTEIYKSLLDEFKRDQHPKSKQLAELQSGQEETQPQEMASEQEESGLTPSERVKRESERYKAQFATNEELEKKLGSLNQEEIRLGRLEKLNQSDKLPKNWERINVDLKSGDLRVPFAANPESQEFVKIVNDFLSGAKESFGARVTNFEVNQFLRRLPSLLNTKEGREAVLRQMKILNSINKLETQGVADVIEKSGGIRKIDLDQARRTARKNNHSEINRLKKEYVEGENTLENLSENHNSDKSTSLKKVSKGTVLTEEKAKNILNKAKGNPKKATEIAKQLGYEIPE